VANAQQTKANMKGSPCQIPSILKLGFMSRASIGPANKAPTVFMSESVVNTVPRSVLSTMGHRRDLVEA
jgi:hypothetical protein